MNGRFGLIVLAVVFVLPTLEVFGGGWNHYKDQGFIMFGTSDFHADEYVWPNGRSFPINTYHSVTMSISGEYGLDDNFTAHFYIPFLKEITLSSLKNRGPSDAIFGLRYGIIQNSSMGWNAGVTMRAPLGDSDDQNNIALGVHDFPVYLSSQLGHSLPWLGAYTVVEAGLNIRMNWFPYEIHSSLEVGVPIIEHFTLIGRVQSMWTLGNGDFEIVPISAGYNGNSVNQGNLAFKLLVEATSRWGYMAEYSFLLHGRSVLVGPTISFGIFHRLGEFTE